MAKLLVVEGPDMGKIYELGYFNSIGSGRHNTITLADRRIAKYHAQIEQKDGCYLIYNLNTRKELLVNGEVLQQAQLHSGDMITIADTILHFVEDHENAPTATVPPVDNLRGELLDESQVISRLEPFRHPAGFLQRVKLTPASQRLATLYKISSAISENQDLQLLLVKILDIIFEEFSADRGRIMILDPAGKRFATEVVKKREKPCVGELPYSHTIVRLVLKHRKPILSTNAMDDERFLDGESIFELNVVSCICVPLVCKNKLLGVIYLDTTFMSQAFSQRDLDQLTQVAMPAAIAIENALNYQRSERYKEHLLALGRFNQTLSSYLIRDKILQEAVHAASALFQCRRVSILTFDAHKKCLQLVYAKGIPPERWPATFVSVGQGLAWQAFAQKRALLFPDSRTHYTPLVDKTPYLKTTDSLMVAPIRSQSQDIASGTTIIGVICVLNKLDGGIFMRMDLDLLCVLANQLGIALTNAELYEQATIDPLTKLCVRRYFFQKLSENIEQTSALGQPLSLIMLDLDHFKKINDNYGHQAGDAVLRQFGKLLKSTVRSHDIAARYGGEEFAIILPATSRRTAAGMAEKIRRQVASNVFPFNGHNFKMTVSGGVGTLQQHEKWKQFLKRTDTALYTAKKRGRNRIVVGT